MVVGLALALAGGGCSSSRSDSIVGTWTAIDSNSTVSLSVSFNSDATFAAHLLRFPSPMTVDEQIQTGAYSVTETELTMTPMESTCPGNMPTTVRLYAVDDDQLTLMELPSSTTPQTILFSRDTTPPTVTGAVLGCFQDEDTLTPGPLRPVGN
jgi:hypothetical protein